MYTHQGNKVTGLTVAYIGGGSRGWAWGVHARHYFRRANQRHGTAVRH